MPGVNRAAVAVTDTFDVWRVRTNELNTSLNAGTHAKTADTIAWRDDNASLIANVVTANTLTMTHQTGTATLVVTSALAADATKAATADTTKSLVIFTQISLSLSLSLSLLFSCLLHRIDLLSTD